MTDTNEIPDLTMPHLSQSIEDAKKAIEKRIQPKTKEDKLADEEAVDPRSKEVYTFKFEHVDTQGKTWRGTFQNRVRTILDRQAQANMQAVWQGGVPYNCYDPEGAFLNEVLAHLAITLTPVEGSGAFTIETLRRATDIDVVNRLYEEVIGHEAKFHERRKTQAGSQASGRK